ncbi:hypothetical protein V3C10_04360 [[Clostridium] symbiosum]|uniref:hypothetical protein n=1 Tax=Clostridium symbiosum TaxID=1512 RepID=UPI001D071D93|nr:hypothetical protein [[Clostridium] symbiosum]MCB6610183.1 hypothetical protein [[Clostridium] symbiosum]MCB6933519.1 hypothetical protein [[Clostridium] symbiosum]
MGKIWMPGGGGGVDLDVVTAAAGDILAGKVIVDKEGNPLTGTMVDRGNWNGTVGMNGETTIPGGKHGGGGKVKGPTVTQRGAWTGRIGANGKITIPEGYHNGSGYVDQSLATKGSATYTPGTSNQTISANQWLTGTQTIKGDANLVSNNIVKGKSIFGVSGGRNYIDKIGTSYNYDGYEMPRSYNTEQTISLNTPETANYPYILVYWGCGGGGYFPLASAAGNTTDRMYLQFTSSLYYKIYMRRPTLSSLQIIFEKVYGSGYGLCNTARVRICAGSNVPFT